MPRHKKTASKTAFYLKYYIILLFAIPLAILIIGYFTAIKSVYGDYLASSQIVEEQKNNVDAIINKLVALKKISARYINLKCHNFIQKTYFLKLSAPVFILFSHNICNLLQNPKLSCIKQVLILFKFPKLLFANLSVQDRKSVV